MSNTRSKQSLDDGKMNRDILHKLSKKEIMNLDTASVFAPAVFSYIWWVLYSAMKKEITTLYFLARDGYLMYRIALLFCEHFQLPIRCKYLYCSRLSLRLPTYHIIGEEAYSLILNGGYQISPYIVLNRVGLTQKERETVYAEIGMPLMNENTTLNITEYKEFAQKVKQSKLFYSLMIQKSKCAYQNTIGYLEQEGLLQEKNVAIVDSGWTGSVQRTLQQLLNSVGAYPKITGFYFGLYEHSADVQDGEYLAWYFDEKSNPFLKAKFNNNLFECLCAAPHEMTIGYQCVNHRYIPIFQTNEEIKSQNEWIHYQLSATELYVKNRLEQIDFYQLLNQENMKNAIKALQKLMVTPTTSQAIEYMHYWFSDDVQESYYQTLVAKVEKERWKNYLLFHRFMKNLRHQTDDANSDNLFWPYGSLALSEVKAKWFYRFNILLWDVLRFIKMRMK